MEKMLRDWRVIAVLVLPGLLLFTAMFLVPVAFTAGYSLNVWDGISPMRFIGMANFRAILARDPIFWTGVRNTAILLATAVVGQLAPALALALVLSRHARGAQMFKTVFFLPVMLSTAAIALIWMKIYEPNFGVLNELLGLVGAKGLQREWLSDARTAIYAVAIPIVWEYIGYHLVILYAGIKSIPDQFYEAALIDGATGARATLSITLPLLRDVLKVCLVLAAVGSLKLFDHIYIMTKGGPYNQSITVALQMYNEAFLKLQFGYGSSIAIFLVLECLVVAWGITTLLTRERVEF